MQELPFVAQDSMPSRLATATLDDVAKLAKVSPITVSRVINRPEMVSEKTAKKVRAAIQKTGYVPNLLAGALVSQRSRLIIVVVPTIANRAFVDTITQLGERLGAARYQLLLSQSNFTPSNESELIDALLARRPDGIVLTRRLTSEEARQKLIVRGVPVVETWEVTDDPIDTVVGFSHEEVGNAMAEHIIQRGKRQVGLIWSDDQRATQRRLACEARLKKSGVSIVACELENAPVDMGHGRTAMARLLSRKLPIDAVICSIDLLAQGAMAEAQAQGLSVPEEIAVMGFGNLEFAAHTNPRLSTVSVDGGLIGLRTADLLIQRIDGSLGRRMHVEDVGFIVVAREST